MIEDTQRQLGDTIKDLINEVKDVVVVLWLEISDLMAMMKVIIMAMGNSLLEGGVSYEKGK